MQRISRPRKNEPNESLNTNRSTNHSTKMYRNKIPKNRINPYTIPQNLQKPRISKIDYPH